VPWESGELNWAWPWLLNHAAVAGLVLARVLGLCLTAPGLAVPELDWRFRIGLAVALGLVLVPVVEPLIVAPTNWQSMAQAVVLELLAGAVLGYLAGTIIAGARFAGELVAAQAGLSTSTLLDPETGEELGPLGRLYGWIAMVAFLALGGPLILVKTLVGSYEAVPAGGLLISAETAQMAFAQVGRALELALRAAAPVALALAMAGIVLGWLSRTASSLPFVALALPIRTLVGVVLVLLSLATLFATLAGLWDTYPWGG
jgi:flagellar biosynthetic protein FliR